jgi:RHS repeat-associated protein
VLYTIANFQADSAYWGQLPGSGGDDYSQPLARPSDVNQVTEYQYDAVGRVIQQIAVAPPNSDGTAVGDNQVTQYVYADQLAEWNYYNNALLVATIYPETGGLHTSIDQWGALDTVDQYGTPQTLDAVTYTYNANGSIQTMTDQRGVEHQYSYDVLGRFTLDSVQHLGDTNQNVEDSVRAIGTTYDDLGRVASVISYLGWTTSSAVVNQVIYTYDDWGNVQTSTQIQGASGPSETVTYGYNTLDRRVSVTYPDNRVVTYTYNDTSGSLDYALGRVTAISDSVSGTLTSYTYRGLATIATQTQGDGTTQTITPDAFGNVQEVVWALTSTPSTILDDYYYTYDADGNVLSKANLLDTDLSESYTYDGLNQLQTAARGDDPLSLGTLDGSGNSDTITVDGTQVAAGYNTENQLTTAGSATLQYDAAGNLTIDQAGNHLTYDAWNRLVTVKDSTSTTTLASYTYNGLGRQVTRTASITTDLYYDDSGNVIEEQQGNEPTADYFWAAVGNANAMVCRFSYDGTGSLTPTRILYAQQDANGNVTSLVDSSAQIAERFVYDPYGNVTVAAADWTQTADGCNWLYMFQGGRFDATTDLYTFGVRSYSPTLQRWTQIDPAGYPDGPNAYEFVGDNPINRLDPSGEAASMNMVPVSGSMQMAPASGGGAAAANPASPGNAAAAANAAATAQANASAAQNIKSASCGPAAGGPLLPPGGPLPPPGGPVHAGIVNCPQALADLARSVANLLKRVAEATNPDAGHRRALRDAMNRVRNDLKRAMDHCGGTVGAGAAIALAKAALDKAQKLLNRFENAVAEAASWAADHPGAVIGTVVVIAGITFVVVATAGSGLPILAAAAAAAGSAAPALAPAIAR